MKMIRAISHIAGLASVLCASCAILATAAAEEFSWQVSGRVQDGDAPGTVQSNRFSLRATYHLSPVDDATGPYELAPFLNRSGYVTIDAARTELREESFPEIARTALVSNGLLPDDMVDSLVVGGLTPSLEFIPTETGIDSSEYAVAGRYVWPATGWYAGAQAQRSDADLLPQVAFTQTAMDQQSTGLFAGRYFGPRTTLELGLGSETMSQELRTDPFGIDPVFVGFRGIAGVGPFDFRVRTDVETENARLSVRHVGDLGGSTFSVSASVRTSWSKTQLFVPAPLGFIVPVNPFDPPEGLVIGAEPQLTPMEISQSESERQYRFSGALFPIEALGVHVTYSGWDHDTFGSSDLLGVSVNWFFIRNAAVEIELIRTGARRGYRPDSRDMDSVGVRLLGRF